MTDERYNEWQELFQSSLADEDEQTALKELYEEEMSHDPYY